MFEVLDLEISDLMRDDWKAILDNISKLFKVPVSLIMRTGAEEIEVFVTNEHPDNPYHVGEKEKLPGLYCEHVMKTNKQLLIPNALKDPDWDKNPDIKLGMISYLGFPLLWPGGHTFGTICVLDNKENAYNELFVEIMHNYKNILENQLSLVFYNYASKQQLEGQLNTRMINFTVEFKKIFDGMEKNIGEIANIIDGKHAELVTDSYRCIMEGRKAIGRFVSASLSDSVDRLAKKR